jgi:hypothetical protein
LGNRDSIQWIDGVPHSNGVVLNSTLIWGADETVQCYPGKGGEQSDILYWQNVIGVPLAGSGVHIIQNTCPRHSSIRNFYINSTGRHPLVRGDGYFHANNFTANPGWETIHIQPCDGGIYGAQADPARFQVINNFMVMGPNTYSGRSQVASLDSTSCTTLQVYEDGNRTMQDDNTVLDCDNHACTDGIAASEFVASAINEVYPAGYVPETIDNDAAGLFEFADQVTSFVGSRPVERLPYLANLVTQAINMVTGSGDEGGCGSRPGAVCSSAGEGGISVITPSSQSYDPTSSATNPCGVDMPIGAAADAIQPSGLTGLHEWVITCFYDDVMPAGYREAL